MNTNTISLGYCPTMTKTVSKVIKDKTHVTPVPFGSAAQALYALRSEQVDAVIIGRYAKAAELAPGTGIIPLEKEGFTLVTHTKGFIDVHDLPGLTVHTYLAESLVKEQYPELDHVSYYPTVEEAFAATRKNEAALISWNDFIDTFELLIPMDENGKIRKYRFPVLFYKETRKDIPEILDIRKTSER